MNCELRRSITFRSRFVVPGFTDSLSAGEYEVIAEDERIEGLSFDMWRRVSTYLVVSQKGPRRVFTELRNTCDADLAALSLQDSSPENL